MRGRIVISKTPCVWLLNVCEKRISSRSFLEAGSKVFVSVEARYRGVFVVEAEDPIESLNFGYADS